ncbi:MAG: tripartite tricarboxylate transporter TctB family protein [Thermodesulfobacteriota bacterium]
MPEDRLGTESRVHDLFGSLLGLFALGLLVTLPWHVDTSGPDPFYKGPLIFPLLVLSLIFGASLPSLWRLLRPAAGAGWYLDGQGLPLRSLRVLALLVLFLAGLIFLGLEVSTWGFLFVALWTVEQRSAWKLFGIPSLVTLSLYLLFKVFLDVWFPEPLLETLLE